VIRAQIGRPTGTKFVAPILNGMKLLARLDPERFTIFDGMTIWYLRIRLCTHTNSRSMEISKRLFRLSCIAFGVHRDCIGRYVEIRIVASPAGLSVAPRIEVESKGDGYPNDRLPH